MTVVFKFYASIGFAFIIGAGVVHVMIWPDNYPLPACLNMIGGWLLGVGMMEEHRVRKP
jgi:hypothetical protein